MPHKMTSHIAVYLTVLCIQRERVSKCDVLHLALHTPLLAFCDSYCLLEKQFKLATYKKQFQTKVKLLTKQHITVHFLAYVQVYAYYYKYNTLKLLSGTKLIMDLY